jgi:hypothetical protein
MTLHDLYCKLDWSKLDDSQLKLASISKSDLLKSETPEQDFSYRFRCAILETAMYGNGEDDRAHAQSLLGSIWVDTVGILKSNKLVSN